MAGAYYPPSGPMPAYSGGYGYGAGYPTNYNQQLPPGPRLIMDYVSGEAEAHGYQMDRNTVAALFDRERPVFYLKEVGLDGKAGSFKVFDYTEQPEPEPLDTSKFLTQADIPAIIKQVIGGLQQHGQSGISGSPAPTAGTGYAQQPAGAQPAANAGDVQRLRTAVSGGPAATGTGTPQQWPNVPGTV